LSGQWNWKSGRTRVIPRLKERAASREKYPSIHTSRTYLLLTYYTHTHAMNDLVHPTSSRHFSVDADEIIQVTVFQRPGPRSPGSLFLHVELWSHETWVVLFGHFLESTTDMLHGRTQNTGVSMKVWMGLAQLFCTCCERLLWVLRAEDLGQQMPEAANATLFISSPHHNHSDLDQTITRRHCLCFPARLPI